MTKQTNKQVDKQTENRQMVKLTKERETDK